MQKLTLSSAASLSSENEILVDWFAAPVLPAPQNATTMIDFRATGAANFINNKPIGPLARACATIKQDAGT